MSNFGDYTKTTYVNTTTPALNATNLNNNENKLDSVDEELRRSQTFNLSDYLKAFHQRNTKEIEDFSDYTEWSAGGSTLSDDTTNKIMNYSSVKSLEPDNTASWVSMSKTITSINLTTFNNGESSDTSDTILFAFYINDVAALTQVQLILGTNVSNCYYITFLAASLSTGWNFKITQKSAFSTLGSPSGWNNITYINCGWYSNVNKINKYVSFQYAQLVREDAVNAGYANPFQLNNGSAFENIFTIGTDYYTIYRDIKYQRLGIIKLNPTNSEAMLHLPYHDVTSFVTKIKMICTNAGNTQSLTWWIDASNYIEVYISSNTLYLYMYEAAAGTTNSVALKTNLGLGDEVTFYFEKDGSEVRLLCEHLGEVQCLEDVTTITNDGCIYLGCSGTSSYSLILDFILSHSQGHNLNKNNIRFIKKNTSEIVNNSDVLQNDDELVVSLDAYSTYEIELSLQVYSNTSADFKCDWVASGGVEYLTTRECIGPATTTTDVRDTTAKLTKHLLTTSVAYGADLVTGATIREKILVTTTNAGTLQLRWAQNSAHASDTTVSRFGSYIKYTKLS